MIVLCEMLFQEIFWEILINNLMVEGYYENSKTTHITVKCT